METEILTCRGCGADVTPGSLHFCQPPSPQVQFRLSELTNYNIPQAEIADLRSKNTHLQEENARFLRELMEMVNLTAELKRLKVEMTDLAASLQIEIAELRAKYEPDPPPAPNPWGKMFRGGIGAAIER